MARFWLSWLESAEDYRPLTYPPNEAVLGWWMTGTAYDKATKEGGLEGYRGTTICALVSAENEETAKEAIRKDWPGAMSEENTRFCRQVEPTYLPNNRFKLADWQRERLGLTKETTDDDAKPG